MSHEGRFQTKKETTTINNIKDIHYTSYSSTLYSTKTLSECLSPAKKRSHSFLNSLKLLVAFSGHIRLLQSLMCDLSKQMTPTWPKIKADAAPWVKSMSNNNKLLHPVFSFLHTNCSLLAVTESCGPRTCVAERWHRRGRKNVWLDGDGWCGSDHVALPSALLLSAGYVPGRT